MLELKTTEQVERYVAERLPPDERSKTMTVERLSGGVSCLVWKVTAGETRWVLKQALGKLDVAEDWFADVARIEREQQAMRFLEPLMPEETIPRIVHSDLLNHAYLMTCAPEEAIPWKSRLMAGEFHPDAARHAGLLLRSMHENSRSAAKEQQAVFDDITFFRELRIDPFHRHLLIQFPELRVEMEVLIHDLEERRSCLVHGDFSPKNMLVDRQQNVVLLDFEVAHWGNPAFDLAFLLAHLLLKGWALRRQADAWKLTDKFLETYGYRHHTEDRLIGHTGALLLARIDGKSTVDYVKDPSLKDRIRRTAIAWIRQPDREAGACLIEAMKG